MLVVFVVTCLCALRAFGVEAQVEVILDDAEIISLDSKYFDAEKTEVLIVENEENGETSMTSKLQILKKIPAIAHVRLTITGISMGKYTIPSGLDLEMEICDVVNEPMIMGPLFAGLGLVTSESCPPGPGLYFQEGYLIPVENVPNDFPENKYLLYFEVTIKGKPIFALNIYADIQAV